MNFIVQEHDKKWIKYYLCYLIASPWVDLENQYSCEIKTLTDICYFTAQTQWIIKWVLLCKFDWLIKFEYQDRFLSSNYFASAWDPLRSLPWPWKDPEMKHNISYLKIIEYF